MVANEGDDREVGDYEDGSRLEGMVEELLEVDDVPSPFTDPELGRLMVSLFVGVLVECSVYWSVGRC